MLRLFRHAFRQLRESPGFAFTAILTLTLGIGASTAIFAVLDAVLLEPLPFAQPDRLVAVQPQPYDDISIPTMQDYRARSTTFASIAAYTGWQPLQKLNDEAAVHKIDAVSQGFFSTLGARFALGGSWPITGNEQDCTSAAIVSGGYWQRIGGAKTLGSKTLNLDGRPFQIVGVLPAEQQIEGSDGLGHPEAFVPLGCDTEEQTQKRGSYDFFAIGRLKSGVTIAQATDDLARVDQTLLKDYPNDYHRSKDGLNNRTKVIPYVDLMVGMETKSSLYIVFAACGLLLLIACSNLANLLLARNTRRRMEFATRASLGATLGQLLQQLMVESIVLVSVGALGSVAFAELVLRGLKAARALQVPRLVHASISLPVVAFVIALCAAVTLLLALLPAWRTLRPGLLLDLQGTARSSAGRSMRVTGRLLVIAQITLTLVLIACAGWMIGSVYLLLHQPLGFDPKPLLTARATFGSSRLPKDELLKAELKFKDMAATVRQLPGVASVAVTGQVPLGHGTNEYDFCSDVHAEQCAGILAGQHPDTSEIDPGYFATVGQPLLEGRDFNAADDGRNHVVIVNQALARREWPGQSALGHRIQTGEIRTLEGDDIVDPSAKVNLAAAPPRMTWATVIGVVGDVKDRDLESTPRANLYVPRAEDPRNSTMLIVRVNGDASLLKETVRAKLKAEFPSGRFYGIETMQERMAEEVLERAFLMRVAIAFGGVALFLSILGTYGLLAYEVSLREKEIGIRLALGSSRERIVTLLLHEEGRWLLAGGVLGLASAAATGYALRARFYQAHATSTPVLLGSAVLLLAPALLAIALPASRAALQDPAETLRRE